MKYASFLHKLNNQPVAILSEYHKATIESAKDLLAGDFTDLFDDVIPVYEEKGNVSIINICGVILPSCSKFEKMLGATSCKEIRGAINQAKKSNATSVIFNINSPGGVVQGIEETAKAINNLNKTKDTYTFCDELMASAGYWLGAQSKNVFVSESASVGSIGVYLSLLTFEKNLAMQGIEAEIIKAGKYKTLGIAAKDLTDEERNYLQEGVNDTYARFQKALSHRELPDEVMQGEVYDGKTAVKNNLADAILSDLDGLVSYLNK
jgi:protease-4